MAAADPSAWNDWCSSQLQIVLLGGRNSGKSHVGNLILGKEEFVTRERTTCSRRLGVVAGRWLTVVDTPGWWCDFSVHDTPELVKREIVSGATLCSPGPHVFLITVKSGSAFSERRRRAVEEHVALLGEKVWSHCMLVLTSTDKLQHSGAEESVERGGKALHWLADKCSQRCHRVVLSDDADADADADADTADLLGKIQKLVEENGSRVYEMQEEMLRANAEEKRAVERRAELRLMRMKQHRSLMRERLRPVTDIRLVLLGAKGSGKTSALSTILCRDSVGPLRRTARCQAGLGLVFGRQLTVVDTPGWWMNYFCDESPVFDRREMVLSLSLCPPGPHVFLLVVRVDRAFTETYRRAAQEHLELIGERIWSRVLLLFTFGDWLGGTTTEQHIESEGRPLRWLAERCGNRYHILNGKTKGDGFQVRELIGKVEEMMSGCDGGWHYEIERNVLEQLETRMRREKQRAEERLMRRQEQRQMAKSQIEKLNNLPELRIVLVGGRKTGKSSCGKTILSKGSFDTDTRTSSCTEKQGSIRGKTVTVLDTPGGFSVTSDLLTPSCVILLVVNVSSSFRDSHRVALEEQLEAGGVRLWSRAAVLFSHGDWLGDTTIEQRIESEGGPLQTLVDKCGNRYHVLDNKSGGDGAQVLELLELMEEILAGDRMASLRRGDHIWKDVSSAGRPPSEAGTSSGKELKEVDRHQLHCDLPELTTSASYPSPDSTEGSDASQMVALRARGGGGGVMFPTVDGFLSYVAAVLSGRQGASWPTVNLPFQICDPLRTTSGGNMFSATLLVSPHTQRRMLVGGEAVNVHTLCHPVLRERTLRKLCQSGGLQALIDQWGESSLEELEAFIDSYFEMVWEQTVGSVQSTEPPAPPTEEEEEEEQQEQEEEEEEEEVLSSIDRKLTKLELLEEIKSDLAELRQSLERSWNAIEELTYKNNGPNNTKH